MKTETIRRNRNLLDVKISQRPSLHTVQNCIEQFTAEIEALEAELDSYQNGRRVFCRDERGEYVDDTPGRVASIERSQNAISEATEMLRNFVSDVKC